MHPLRIALPLLCATLVAATYGGGHRGHYAEYDCGGTCGGGCGYGNPCGNSAPIVEPSGCGGGECGGSSHTSGHRSSSGYHKSVTTVVKETRNDELKIVVGKPTVHRASYIEPQPVIRRTTYIEQPAPAPVVYHKKQRYVEDAGDYGSSGCGGSCGGGSKIVKIIKKTTYADGGGSCSTCGSDGYSAGYSGEVEYSQPVIRKVTRIVTQPKVVVHRVVKTVEAPSSEYYEDSGSSYQGHRGGGGGGGGHHGGRHKSYGGGGAKAFAFASASASAGAFGGSGGGGSEDYTSGGGGGGCKSGCDQWKK